jgi:hypothetical protein
MELDGKLPWKLNGENWVLFAGLIDGLIGVCEDVK